MKKTVCGVAVLIVVLIALLAGCSSGSAISATISRDNLGVSVSEDLYGLFLEDISYACDGGLVSELVCNGSFEYDADKLTGWRFSATNAVAASGDGLNENNPSYLRVTANGCGRLENLGYVEYYDYLTKDYNEEKMNTADMGFKKGTSYECSFYVKNESFVGGLSVGLSSDSNSDLTEVALPESGTGWVKRSMTLTSAATEDGGLILEIVGNGNLCIDFVSLVPHDSHGYGSEEWKYVTLRSDLTQALKELSPSFIRFPGGCLAEGDDFEHLFDWKSTVGALESRPQYHNIWNDDENGKSYNNTFAMGYHEYFQLSEDLGAAPLPILNVGMICQFKAKYNQKLKEYEKGKLTNTEFEAYLDTVALRPGTSEFDAYVQDIYDLVEYANGDVTTTWGAKRAENGHPEPFNLRYIGLGNENWGDLYWRNFDALYNAVKAKHPEITIISSASYQFAGDTVDEAWEIINEKYVDTVVDEHYYTGGNKLFKNNRRYDAYDRNGAKVFVGEYAVTCRGIGKYITKNNLWAAVEEASYMTAMERNGDIVAMASYAPTFAKVNAHCWDINLIWFDSQSIILTPNYYTQMLFSNNRGKRVVNTDMDEKGYYAVTTVDESTQTLYVKLVNAGSKAREVQLNVEDFGVVNGGSMQYISGVKAACNEPNYTTVVPRNVACDVDGNGVSVTVEPQSVNVIRIFYGDNHGENAYSLPSIPPTMDSNVVEYDKFFITPEVVIAISVCGGTVVLAALIIVVVLMRRRYYKRVAAEDEREDGEEEEDEEEEEEE